MATSQPVGTQMGIGPGLARPWVWAAVGGVVTLAGVWAASVATALCGCAALLSALLGMFSPWRNSARAHWALIAIFVFVAGVLFWLAAPEMAKVLGAVGAGDRADFLLPR